MSRLPREPLDARERELAAALPRLHGRDQPDAALDARILAAAHAAVREPVRPVRKRRSWLAPLSVAASLCLAVGLAWQLRPPASPAATDMPADAAGTEQAASVRFVGPPEQPKPMAMPAPPPEVLPARTVAPQMREYAPVADAAASHAAAPPPAEEPATDAFEAPAAAAIAPPPAPPAPPVAAPAATASVDNVATDAVLARDQASASGLVGAQAKAMAPRKDEARRAANATTLDSISVDAPDEDVPPATMDGPQARDAWLKRIRELQQQGKLDEARASLAEFRRRYPKDDVPRELRTLEAPAATDPPAN